MMTWRNKPVVLKRNLKLRELKYEIKGTESSTPAFEIFTAILIGAFIALMIFTVSLAIISEYFN